MPKDCEGMPQAKLSFESENGRVGLSARWRWFRDHKTDNPKSKAKPRH